MEKQEKNFCETEEKIYEEFIDLLELDVDNSGLITYNKVCITFNNKKLIKLCDKTLGYDFNNYITFRPLKNHKHCQIIIDYLHENESSQYEIYTKRIVSDQGPVHYTARMYDQQSDLTICESKESASEVEAKFKLLYMYFFGDNDIEKRILDINKYNNKLYKENQKNIKRKKGK